MFSWGEVFLVCSISNLVNKQVCIGSTCCALLYVHSSIVIILMGKRELVALLGLSSLCLMMVEQLFLAVPRGCLQFVIVVFPDHTHYFCIGSITHRGFQNTEAYI